MVTGSADHAAAVTAAQLADPDLDGVETGSTLSDADLLALCRAGDPQSWSSLVQRYARLVTTVAVRAGLPEPDVEDVTQATFVALLESGTALRQDQRLSSWLVTVAQRKSWQARRRVERERPLAELPDAADLPQETWERVAVLESAFARLGQPCRDLLEALYLDPTQPSYAEIAARLERPIGTIGPTRGRCLTKLRRLVGEDVW